MCKSVEMSITQISIGVCFAVVFRLQTPHGLPIINSSDDDNVTNTTGSQQPLHQGLSPLELNCSGANASYNTYTNDLLRLSVGVYLLRYSSSRIYTRRVSEYPSSADCSSPVEYTGIYRPSQTVRVQDIASWFSVFQNFTAYLESLSQTDTAADDVDVLQNITAILDAVLRDYVDVLQDVKCNCSSACRVIPVPIIPPPQCSDVVTNAYHHLYKATLLAYATMGQFKLPVPSALQINSWIGANNLVLY